MENRLHAQQKELDKITMGTNEEIRADERAKTLRAVGEWLDSLDWTGEKRYQHLILTEDVESLKQGRFPESK